MPSPNDDAAEGSNDRLAASVSPPAVAAVAAMLATAAILLAPAGVCRAQPQPGTVVTGSAYSLVGTGLRVTVDNRFLDNPGYRPFRITVTPTTPVTADRTLTVQLVFRKRLRHERILRVDRDIEIPAGSGPIETVISVPQVDYWDSYDFRVSEDGTFLPVALPADAYGVASRVRSTERTSSGCLVCWSWATPCPTRRSSP